jgi:23S rRNA (adenine2503-C2)-methyltransferase
VRDWVKELGLPIYRAEQIFAWVHGKGITSTEPMTNLSKELRAQLAQRISLRPLEVEEQQRSSDGTEKLLLRCVDGLAIETVLIPDGTKLTQCVSTQVGCNMSCTFCATAQLGLRRNLEAGEIVDQVYRARARLSPEQRITNLVFMGMGEPLNNLDRVLRAVAILCTDQGANFSRRRITISTAGVVPGIINLGRRDRHIGLAVSLNATTDEVRNRLMPINRRWPLSVLLKALREFPLPRRRRITFEYVLLAGINDTAADARRFSRLLQGIPAKVNLIPYNNSGQSDSLYREPEADEVNAFAEALRAKDLSTFVRQSRGEDIAAACGQLVGSPR